MKVANLMINLVLDLYTKNRNNNNTFQSDTPAGQRIVFYSSLFDFILSYSVIFYSILFCSVLFYSIVFFSILFYSFLFLSVLYSIPFGSILIYSIILFYFILLYFALLCSILFYATLFCSVLFYSILRYRTLSLFYSYSTPTLFLVLLCSYSAPTGAPGRAPACTRTLIVYSSLL